MENHHKEVKFISQSILYSVIRGIVVGTGVGVVVVAFRLAIQKLFEMVTYLYHQAHHQPFYLLVIILFYAFIVVFVGKMIAGAPDAKGSGIPQVEAELKGMMQLQWWTVLWRKFIGGSLAIASGLMLGREGPSIQLGAVTAKGIAEGLKASKMEKRSLIASGAAAGLAAAFNAPIAGLLFVVEEVYHQFSRLVWVSALAASITANFISLHVFGLTPVLQMPEHLPVLELKQYWIYIVLGLFLGLAGFFYEIVILHIQYFYDFLSKIIPLPSQYHSLFAFIFILPIGYFFPELLGGGHHLILELPHFQPSLVILIVYLVIRFIWSMIAYGSGLPGGIFLPILTLGSLLGLVFGRLTFDFGWIAQEQMSLFIVLGMAGFFAAISKAPLTAMILVTEMVGNMSQLMVIGLVALSAYIIMDLLGGAPIYEAMLEKLLPENLEHNADMTLIEVVVSEKLGDTFVSELPLPPSCLITSQIHHGKSKVVKGNSLLHTGDTLYVALPVSEIHTVRHIFEGNK
ncbi:ClC family H(+)/Cl(-) exchange transporter [Streptococcus minor]|uniref:ClC family H(+)/Cl(-) exchange transporter n=1 Tax=Streptococcus minor TaxID=229549 RepID=A0A3P1VFV2_9STRE|nr:ClC family H(+)/Cl(-) exchange transporter [Streptococcus minor]RRD32385.1 ClC family H(+)/Cl(-) exchange transporter [Streptococcus minor]